MNDTMRPSGPIWQRMDKRLLAAIAGALVLALIAGGVALARRGGAGKDTADTKATSESTSTASATQTPSGQPAPNPATVPGRPVPGKTPGSPTARPPAGTGQTSGAPQRPKAPAAEGSKLATITAPPEKTLALLDPKKVDAAIEWDIEFSPYGFAPSPASAPKRVVIRVSSAKQTAGKASDLQLQDRNMLVLLDGDQSVTLGGDYSGHVSLREQGGVLSLILTEVKAE